MKSNQLPTDDLKKFGIIDNDNSFSKKLSVDDIQKFLQGDTIIAENEKNSISFRLTENNTRLDVKMYEKDRTYKEILDAIADNPRSVQYAYEKELSQQEAEKNFTKLAFLMKDDMHVYSYDMVKDAEKLTEAVAEKKDLNEFNIYKTELEKLKSFLLDKIDKYPEAAKQITENMNIISNEINSVNSMTTELNQTKANNSEVRLDVNDPDLYQDVNTQRELEEQEEENKTSRGRGR